MCPAERNSGRHKCSTHQIDFVLLPVVNGGDGLKHTVGVKLGPDVSVLKHKSLSDLVNLGFLKGSNLEGMLGRVVNPNVSEVIVTGNCDELVNVSY